MSHLALTIKPKWPLKQCNAIEVLKLKALIHFDKTICPVRQRYASLGKQVCTG